MLVTKERGKTGNKREFNKDGQKSETLGMLLKAGRKDDMIRALLNKYVKDQGDATERSNYT